MRKSLVFTITVLSFACSTSTRESQETEAVTVDTVYSQSQEQAWDYSSLYGNYLHESSTGGFSSTLVLEPQGLNIAYTLISAKGESCQGEASGNIAMMNHTDKFHTGYSISEDCKLEFIFRHQEDKVDVKEIHICTLHGADCGFEGTYAKINNQD